MISIATKVPTIRSANKGEAAEFFDVSIPTIVSWIRRGAPVVQKGRQGLPWVLDLRAVAEWKYGVKTSDDGQADPDSMTPKERLDWYKGNREKTRDMEDAGELIQSKDVEASFSSLFKSLAQAIEVFPDRAEREHGATPDEVARLQGLGDLLRELMHKAATEK